MNDAGDFIAFSYFYILLVLHSRDWLAFEDHSSTEWLNPLGRMPRPPLPIYTHASTFSKILNVN